MRRPAPRFLYASFEARVAAAALDALVLFIILAVLAIAGSLAILISSDFERVNASDTSINVFWACLGSAPPLFLLYFFISFAWRGQTAGAAVMRTVVVRSDGRPLGVFGAIARVIALLVYPLIFGFGAVGAYAFRDDPIVAASTIGAAILAALLGVLWSAFDPHRRTLHDRIAGTIVVRAA